MRATVTLDDENVANAKERTGITDTASLMRAAHTSGFAPALIPSAFSVTTPRKTTDRFVLQWHQKDFSALTFRAMHAWLKGLCGLGSLC